MHDVGVTLDDHLLGDFDRTGCRHPAGIVAAQINQHQVLGDFLVIRQQVLFQC
ncbi:hypothetical protein D3C78_840450 [compost metagenome]